MSGARNDGGAVAAGAVSVSGAVSGLWRTRGVAGTEGFAAVGAHLSGVYAVCAAVAPGG